MIYQCALVRVFLSIMGNEALLSNIQGSIKKCWWSDHFVEIGGLVYTIISLITRVSALWKNLNGCSCFVWWQVYVLAFQEELSKLNEEVTRLQNKARHLNYLFNLLFLPFLCWISEKVVCRPLRQFQIWQDI